MIGKELGHYRVIEPLGKGGMGEVYRARDTKLDRDVALKILPDDAGDDPARGARFEREAKLIASLNHPNIVTIHAVEEIDGVRFLAMEVVEGKTLDEVIPEGGLPLDRLFEIAIPLADALSSAHAKGITHRDLKPTNVMLDAENRVKVLDFGLAKLVMPADTSEQETIAADEQVTAEGKILGTVAYMSPEQAEGKPLDHRSDIFSLGILLYQLATGKRPFAGDTPISTVSAILRDTPPSITQIRSSIPRHLGRVIGRCLEKNPEKRFQTARDVCNELEGLQKEIASGEHDELAPQTVDRSRSRTWLGVTVAIAALAIATYAFFFRAPAPEKDRMLTTRPLTSLLSWETAGSWSPDGNFIAYYHSANGPANISVVSTSGGDPISLVESEWDDMSPRWSPDNRWIAFVSNRGGETAVYLVPPLGGTLRRLVDIGLPSMSDALTGALGSMPWSTDGRTLLVSRRSPDGTLALWKVDVETGAQEQITRPGPGESDSEACWSFAGDRIAFNRSTASGASLLVMPAAGGRPGEVYSGPDEFFMLSWSPDDRSLVYSSNWGTGGIWSVALDGSRRRQLTAGADQGTGPIVSREGRILFSTGSHQTDLYVQDLRGDEERRLTAHAFDNFVPRFSPDGHAVVYASTRTGNGEVWIIDLEQNRERQLTDSPGDDMSPDWSPDGLEIAWVAHREDRPELWIADAAGGVSRKVTEHEIAYPKVRFVPDGSGIGFLAAGSEGLSLYVADRETGQSREVLAGVADFDWYRDGRQVIYTPSAPESSNELRVVDLGTGRKAVLLEEPHVELDVSPDGSALSYVSSKSHSAMALFVLRLDVPALEGELPRAAGPPEQIAHGEGHWHVHNGGWSPDGKKVIYTRDTDTGDVYVLDGAFD